MRWTPKTLSEAVDRATASMEAIGWQVSRYRESGSGARKWMFVPPASGNGHGYVAAGNRHGDITKTWNGE
jgi:hypothetical protein